MPREEAQQMVRIGVDVGGTFTDLVAWDGAHLHIIKIPSTPPEFQKAVIDAVARVCDRTWQRHLSATAGGASEIGSTGVSIVHGSTVATNALLQRRGEPVAFVTTEGF